LIALLVSYIFIYGAYKLWHLRRDINNHFKF
jgi:hypothetical protein